MMQNPCRMMKPSKHTRNSWHMQQSLTTHVLMCQQWQCCSWCKPSSCLYKSAKVWKWYHCDCNAFATHTKDQDKAEQSKKAEKSMKTMIMTLTLLMMLMKLPSLQAIQLLLATKKSVLRILVMTMGRLLLVLAGNNFSTLVIPDNNEFIVALASGDRWINPLQVNQSTIQAFKTNTSFSYSRWGKPAMSE